MNDQQFDPEKIKALETKMLPSPNGRDANASAKDVLSREERLEYANYLDSINQPISAAFFRK